jgi:hypothetical protein
MDIKQRLAQAIEKQRVVAYEPVDVDIVELCQYALAEIERLEKGNKSDKITRLETLVCMLAFLYLHPTDRFEEGIQAWTSNRS